MPSSTLETPSPHQASSYITHDDLGKKICIQLVYSTFTFVAGAAPVVHALKPLSVRQDHIFTIQLLAIAGHPLGTIGMESIDSPHKGNRYLGTWYIRLYIPM